MTYIIRLEDTEPFDTYIFPTLANGSSDNNFLMAENATARVAYPQEMIDKAYKDAFIDGEKSGYDSGFEKGEKEGYAAGLVKGIEQGMQEGQQELNVTLSALNSAILQSQEDVLNIREDIKKVALSMITDIAQKVVNNELALNPKIILQWIEDSIASLPEEPAKITITLNDDDYQRIVSLEELPDTTWKLKSNSQIKLGCCEVNTNLGDIKIDPQEKIKTMVEQVK